MKTIKRAAVLKNSKRNVTDNTTVQVTDLRKHINIPSRLRKRLWKTLWPYVPIGMLLNIEEGLRGFDHRIQSFMIEAVNDYLSDKTRHYATIPAANEVLVNLCNEIDRLIEEPEKQLSGFSLDTEIE